MTERGTPRNGTDTGSDERAISGQLTRGFLFADLRGYTAFVDTNGARRAAALVARFRSLVRAAVDESAGAEIRTEGDSFFVVFPSASAALGCAFDIIRAGADDLGGDPIRVGIG